MGWEWHMVEEEKALRALRKVMDATARRLGEPGTSAAEAERIMEMTRNWVYKVFPDKLQAYDLIYKPRFETIIHGGKSKTRT